ncbi:hypothetical protein AAES_08249 [Amazona aestiva]|uniref:WHIM1 domain-containing protein n=1 Tax=Amazona aestiva TaxID=12930 RepID=A0A0Q3X8Y8_AMAAE|nr:hypothetical protein AAES_08249 [Amazona aestiva]
MEADAHFSFASAAASGPKPAAASGDGAFGPGAALGFSPQGKGLNGGTNVNGFSTASHPSTSGPLAPSSPPAGAQPLRPYDCLWDYAPFPGLKDGRSSTPPLFALNGTEPRSPGHGANLRAPELWGNGGAGAMGLNFDSQELYDSFHEPSFELMPNGAPGFYGAAQPFPEEPGTGDGGADAAAKENGAGLVGSMELEEAQPELKLCGYNGAAPGAGGPGLGAASPIAPRLEDAPILSEDPLEPFGSLGAGWDSLKILGEKVSEISLNRDTVSEILRCFLTAHGAGEELCEGLRTKPFQALPPDTKASILAFLVDELNSSALIISEIDKTLESMASYRKNKWIIEGRLRRWGVPLCVPHCCLGVPLCVRH